MQRLGELGHQGRRWGLSGRQPLIHRDEVRGLMAPRKPTRKKGNAPAFQFYVGDFMTGTITMSVAEVGAYIRLLIHQWSAKSVPGDDVSALARAMGCDRAEAEQIWSKIQHKFREKNPGVWVNVRLEIERKKQKAFRKLQSDKGKASAAAKAESQPRLNRDGNRTPTLHSSPSGLDQPPNPLPGGLRKRRGPKLREVPKADQASIDQAIETRRRRAEMAERGMSEDEIEAQLEREYLERKKVS